jgi:hyperosmotically inducible periplasmic protein
MQTFKKSILSASLLCAIALSGAACATDKTDALAQSNLAARQEAQIQTAYFLSPYLRSTEIKVSVLNSKATLSGKVDEATGKELAGQIALHADGIKSVDNQIEVDPKYVYISPSERSYGEMVDDMGTTSVIKSKLLWSKHADGLNTNVDTQRGKVTLTGTASSKEAQVFAGQLAQNTKGVVSVENRLEVVVPKAEEVSTGSVGEEISDTWITTKVKSTFLYSRQVTGHEISVATKDGVVTLTGHLMSQQERSMAIELAQGLRGVKEVNADALTVN